MGLFSNLFGKQDLLYIHTDKQQYYAGEQVTGQVILSVIQPIHIDAIYLKLSGYEETSFDVSRSRTVYDKNNQPRTEHYKQHVTGNNTFFKRRYGLYSQKTTLHAGNFVFPFQFILNANLPGTFNLYSQKHFSSRVQAKVWYSVEAEVAVPGLLTPNLRHSQDIIIHEPLRIAPMASETHKESKVTFLCCIPKGTINMSATIDKNAYGPGETVGLRLIVDNSQSTVDLEALSLKLVAQISLKANGGSTGSTGTVVKARTPGLKAGERADRFIQLTLPLDTEPSTHSKLIECSYILSVELKVPWSPDVVVRQPVQIYAPVQSTYIAQLQYPSNWAPSVFPTSDLQTMQYVTY